MDSVLIPNSLAFFSVLAFFDAKVFSLGLLFLYCVTLKKRVTHDRKKWDHQSLNMIVKVVGGITQSQVGVRAGSMNGASLWFVNDFLLSFFIEKLNMILFDIGYSEIQSVNVKLMKIEKL